MGRPKKFSRDEVLDKVIPVFLKHGFADTSVQELEKATGVNKSGLYSEFQDKDDLYLSSLKHYLSRNDVRPLLQKSPLGWGNVEAFLKAGQDCPNAKGCFAINSIREISSLPKQAGTIISDHLRLIRSMLEKNIEAEKVRTSPTAIADLILTFNSGLRLEQNLRGNAPSREKIDGFLKAIRAL